MTRRSDALAQESPKLAAESVLARCDMAVFVTDRYGNVLYWNDYAERLFGFHADSMSERAGPGQWIAEEDYAQAAEVARFVLKGNVWEGTFCSVHSAGTRIFTRVHAVPHRDRDGAIDGAVIFAREAMRRGNVFEQDKYGLLERIGERLASSLDLRATLDQVSASLVPQFADHCIVDLYKDGRLVRYVSKHAGGWEPPSAWAAVGEEINYPAEHPASKAMRREEAVLHDQDRVDLPAPSEASAELGRRVGLTSLICAPLHARGVLHGMISVAKSALTVHDDPHYNGFDLDLIGTVAGRVALAIDNALLFEEERDAALTFQRGLLPQQMPRIDGLEIAHHYIPARPLWEQGQGIQTQVGGDWYDVIPLSAGRVGIVIGDVEGRGAAAAAVMGQLRAALRAFAQVDKSPADVLTQLDGWVRSLGEEQCVHYGEARTPFVTCMYLVYDAWSRQLSFAVAGHARPLLLSDGEVTQMELEEEDLGLPLGVRGPGIPANPYREQTCELPPGTSLLLYTDGLIERRPGQESTRLAGEDPLDVLCDAVAPLSEKGVNELVRAAAEAVPGDVDDDMALLVLRSSPQELPVAERTFPAEPYMVSEARRLASETLSRWTISTEHAELACLLVSEVVTNVVLHASVTPSPTRELVLDDVDDSTAGFDDPWDVFVGESVVEDPKEFTLRLRRGTSAVWVEVFDQDLRLPRIRRAADDDEGGRGLYLLDQLAKRWGSRPTREGKAVWFEVPL